MAESFERPLLPVEKGVQVPAHALQLGSQSDRRDALAGLTFHDARGGSVDPAQAGRKQSACRRAGQGGHAGQTKYDPKAQILEQLLKFMNGIGGFADHQRALGQVRGQSANGHLLSRAPFIFHIWQLDLVEPLPRHQTFRQLPRQPSTLGVIHAVDEQPANPTSGLDLAH